MRPEHLYLLGTALPLAVAVALALGGVWAAGAGIQKKTAARRNRKALLSSLPEALKRAQAKEGRPGFLHSWEGYFDSQLKRAGWNIRPATVLSLSAVLAMAGAVIGIVLLRDAAMAITLAVVMVFFPMLVLNWAVQKYEQKKLEQLPTAVQLFVVEFEMCKNVGEALMKASQGVGNPLRGYMENCAKELAAGRPPKVAFRNFAAGLDCEYGRLWAQMLLAGSEDATVVKLMPRLISRLSGQRMLMQKNLTELSGIKRIGTILNLLVVPGFVAVQVMFPDAMGFFSTPLGKAVVVVLILSVIVGILLDQTLKKVEI